MADSDVILPYTIRAQNARGSASDTPDTARDSLLVLGAQWLRDAGAQLALAPGVVGVEVPALVSYGGEGLEDLMRGKVVSTDQLQV